MCCIQELNAVFCTHIETFKNGFQKAKLTDKRKHVKVNIRDPHPYTERQVVRALFRMKSKFDQHSKVTKTIKIQPFSLMRF